MIAANEADNRILECAMEASAEYLVTGDRKHLLPLEEHRSVRILNAPRFLAVLVDRPLEDGGQDRLNRWPLAEGTGTVDPKHLTDSYFGLFDC